MLYYLFDITVTVEANEIKETYTDAFLAKFPDGTGRATIEITAEDVMDKAADHYGDVFCYMHPCADANVQTDLNAYQLTEEEYNHFHAEYGEEE